MLTGGCRFIDESIFLLLAKSESKKFAPCLLLPARGLPEWHASLEAFSAAQHSWREREKKTHIERSSFRKHATPGRDPFSNQQHSTIFLNFTVFNTNHLSLAGMKYISRLSGDVKKMCRNLLSRSRSKGWVAGEIKSRKRGVGSRLLTARGTWRNQKLFSTRPRFQFAL